jgi:DNA-binding NarL/FixJ family response regulator
VCGSSQAETGEAGLALCRQYAPDLILLDYRLPDMDGLEFIDFYRQEHPQYSDRLPIFLLSGQAEEEIAVLAAQAKVLAYLIKGELTRESLSLSVRTALDAGDRVHLAK